MKSNRRLKELWEILGWMQYLSGNRFVEHWRQGEGNDDPEGNLEKDSRIFWNIPCTLFNGKILKRKNNCWKTLYGIRITYHPDNYHHNNNNEVKFYEFPSVKRLIKKSIVICYDHNFHYRIEFREYYAGLWVWGLMGNLGEKFGG